jgi:hypothetical protein
VDRAGEPAKPAVTAVPEPAQVLTAELDRLNLEQALRDTEVANQRVMDLTQRLVGAAQQNQELRVELDTVRTRLAELGQRVDSVEQVRGTKAYRLASLALRIAARARRG